MGVGHTVGRTPWETVFETASAMVAAAAEEEFEDWKIGCRERAWKCDDDDA
jgi:hypothetical protein